MRRLAERFWNLAKGFESEEAEGADPPDPVAVVRHVLRILDAFDRGAGTTEVSVSTQSFLVLLRQHELEGDLLYAAPEQVRGEMMDERSLVFSVGVLLFEKLTGRHPFGAEGNPNRVARMQKGQIGSGVNYFPVIPGGLRTLLMKAMGPFPEERWSSLKEMRAELEAFVAESTGVQPPRDDKRHKVVTLMPAGGKRAGEDEQTRVVRRDPAPVVTPALEERPARPSPTSEMMAARGRPAPAWHSALWAAAGSAVTAVIFLLVRPGAPQVVPPPTVSSDVSAETRAPVATPLPAEPAVEILDDPPAKAARVSAETPAPAMPALPARPPARVSAETPAPAAQVPAGAPTPAPSLLFDPADVGRRAASVLETCFTPARLAIPGGISLGATLVFNPASLTATKIYFAGTDSLAPAEHKCARAELMGIAAGTPPPRGTLVDYQFRLKPGGTTVKHRLVK